MTTNYLQMMIDSLKKKKGILIRIIELNEEQNQIISEETLNGDAFDDNMKAKGSCIDELEDRKSTRLNSSHRSQSRMPSSA